MELVEVYLKLLDEYGPQGWWPMQHGFSPPEWEVCAGAILTQNTNWGNVEKALARLKSGGIVSPEKTLGVHNEHLQEFVRPSGYYTQKARRLKLLAEYVSRFEPGSFRKGADRDDLLAIHGIGPETADSIMLYAAGRKFFVVDGYTRRIFTRFGLIEERWDYEKVRLFFEKKLPQDVNVYKEFHALIVRLGKHTCKSKPLCGACPISDSCMYPRKRKK